MSDEEYRAIYFNNRPATRNRDKKEETFVAESLNEWQTRLLGWIRDRLGSVMVIGHYDEGANRLESIGNLLAAIASAARCDWLVILDEVCVKARTWIKRQSLDFFTLGQVLAHSLWYGLCQLHGVNYEAAQRGAV